MRRVYFFRDDFLRLVALSIKRIMATATAEEIAPITTNVNTFENGSSFAFTSLRISSSGVLRGIDELQSLVPSIGSSQISFAYTFVLISELDINKVTLTSKMLIINILLGASVCLFISIMVIS
jgi:hypothetical protein